mmetsp:Transcript_84036/g.246524  ORF Transcript_84036/g.246524 Transcript_84036/m.246524 type:complete len:201 (+) Transcript_84036:546-1148(+)
MVGLVLHDAAQIITIRLLNKSFLCLQHRQVRGAGIAPDEVPSVPAPGEPVHLFKVHNKAKRRRVRLTLCASLEVEGRNAEGQCAKAPARDLCRHVRHDQEAREQPHWHAQDSWGSRSRRVAIYVACSAVLGYQAAASLAKMRVGRLALLAVLPCAVGPTLELGAFVALSCEGSAHVSHAELAIVYAVLERPARAALYLDI